MYIPIIDLIFKNKDFLLLKINTTLEMSYYLYISIGYLVLHIVTVDSNWVSLQLVIE